MPDTLEPGGGGRYPADMESRVAVLEQIARVTTASLERIERRLDAMDERTQRRLDALSAEHHADFRWLLGVMLGGLATMLGGFGALLGVMAHGFHWL
jgi:hypothetical protein